MPVVHKTATPEKPVSAERVADRTPEKAMAKMPDVPKAVPITKEMLQARQPGKEPNKKLETTPVAADRTPYVVKQGETLYKIASKHGVTVAALQKANNITKPELLREGMKLVIP
jgi:LysM repeat protein